MKLIPKLRVATAQDFAPDRTAVEAARATLAAAIDRHAKARSAVAGLQSSTEGADEKIYSARHGVEAAEKALAGYSDAAAEWLAGSLMGADVGTELDHAALQADVDRAKRDLAIARKARLNIDAAVKVAETELFFSASARDKAATAVLKLCPAAAKTAERVAALQRELVMVGAELGEVVSLHLVDHKGDDGNRSDAVAINWRLQSAPIAWHD